MENCPTARREHYRRYTQILPPYDLSRMPVNHIKEASYSTYSAVGFSNLK